MLLNNSTLNSLLLNDDDTSSSDGGGTGGGAGGAGGTGGTVGRYINGTDVALMLDGNYSVWVRVRIADPAGVLRDYSTRDNINWIISASWTATLDDAIGTATVKLFREVGGRSLAPFRSNSAYNLIPFVEADLTQGIGPSLDVGRQIFIDVAVLPLDASGPLTGDWINQFEGRISDLDWSKEQVVINARDKAGVIQDTWFSVPNDISAADFSVSTLNIQTALAGLLDLGHLDVFTPLEVPVLPDPEVVIPTFHYDIEPVMDAMQRLAQTNGWDLRERYSDLHQEFRLTYKDPGRDRTDADFVLYPHSYVDLTVVKIDETGVRNDVTVNFGPDSAHITSINEYSPESVRRYGRRSMVDNEASNSPIQDEDSARLMARLILFDIANPVVDMTVDMFFFWAFEIHNIVRFPPNGSHFDGTLDLRVVGYTHTVEAAGKARTNLQVRGNAYGGYWRWLGRRPSIGDGLVDNGTAPSGPGFGTLTQTPDYAADTIQLDWAWSGDPSATFDVYTALGGSGFTLEASGLTSPTHVASAGEDIEPFHTPPDPPQIPVYFSFYVVAKVSGMPDVTSVTCMNSYGFGP